MTSFSDLSISSGMLAGRPTSLNWHLWCPDGKTVFYYGGSEPTFTPQNKAMCNSWAPKVIPWPYPSKIVQISVGNAHALILTDDNKVYGTGSNQFGQLGNSTRDILPVCEKFVEIDVPTTDRIVQIEAGICASQSMVLTDTGDVYSCGELCGRVHSPESPFDRMVMIDRAHFDNVPVKQVSGGGCMVDCYGCFVTVDGGIYGIGHSANADAGIPGHFVPTPVKIMSLWEAGVRVKMVSCGRMVSIAIATVLASANTYSTDATAGDLSLESKTVIYGWGENESGALGEDFRTHPKLLRPTLLTNTMSKYDETQDTPIHVSCGWYHSLITLQSGRVLSLGASNLYGQLGRAAPTVYPLPYDLAVDCCEYMTLDRPVRAAFAGGYHSILIPRESTALFSTESTDLATCVFGTCGCGGKGQLALWDETTITEWNRYQCRFTVQFFSLAQAIASADQAPKPPTAGEDLYGGSSSSNRRAHLGGKSGVAKKQRREEEEDHEEEEDYEDVEEEDNDDDDDDDDDIEDPMAIAIDFGDVPVTSTDASAVSSAFESLPTRLVAALLQAWKIPTETTDSQEILAIIQKKEEDYVQQKHIQAHLRKLKMVNCERKDSTLLRYALIISNHYNMVRIEDLVSALSSSKSASASVAASTGSDDVSSDKSPDFHDLLDHVRLHLKEVMFVSCSLYAKDRSVVEEMGHLLRNTTLFPRFTTFTLDQTSILDQEGFEKMQSVGDMVPDMEDQVFAAFVTALLHADHHHANRRSKALTTGAAVAAAGVVDASLVRSKVEKLEFHNVSCVGTKSLQALKEALQSYEDPSTQVALQVLSCDGSGFTSTSAGDEDNDADNEDEAADEAETGGDDIAANARDEEDNEEDNDHYDGDNNDGDGDDGYDNGEELRDDDEDGINHKAIRKNFKRSLPAYALIRDIIALNLPSMTALHLPNHDTSMCEDVARLLAPVLQRNTYLQRLSLAVNELGAPGVGMGGVRVLYDALRHHAHPTQCVLYDVDVSGDDGVPYLYGAKDGKVLQKQWRAIMQRNGRNHLRIMNEKRAASASPSQATESASSAEPNKRNKQQKQHKKKKNNNNNNSKKNDLPLVTEAEAKKVKYIVERPLDVSADRWEEDRRYA